jgi:Lar family restriction alleviation protein
MKQPRVTDNDKDGITVTLNGKELRGWSYASDDERRQKMLLAREYVEGWFDAVNQSPGMNEREGVEPCPFCGGEGAITTGISPRGIKTVDVICQACSGTMPAFCEEDAVADWNTRAPAPSAWQPDDRFQKGFNLALKQCAEAVKFCGECDCPRMTVDAIKALSLPSSDRGGVGGSPNH